MSAWSALLGSRRLDEGGIDVQKDGLQIRGLIKFVKLTAGDVVVECHALMQRVGDGEWQKIGGKRIVFDEFSTAPSDVGEGCWFCDARSHGYITIYPPRHPKLREFFREKRALQTA